MDEREPPQLDTNQVIAERREKLRALRAEGNAYPNDFSRDALAADLLAKYQDIERDALDKEGVNVRVAGRIRLKRVMGKASFCTIQDMSGQVQLYVTDNHTGRDEHEAFKRWDIGDIVGAEGTLFKTKTGELTVRAGKVRLLSKALRPLPEKFHGLTDQEMRYRQRYVDLIVNPDVREVFRKRSTIIRTIRQFLDNRGFLEVETPVLQTIIGGAAARPFATHHNALDLDMVLRIAPELYLKRLVVGGFDRVYEIGRNFRNEGLSRKHNPEFTMLEFYQAYATYADLMNLTEEMLLAVAGEVGVGRQLTYEGKQIDLTAPWPRIPMKDAIVTASRDGQLPAGLERAALDDEGALKAWIESSGTGARKDELGAILRKCDSHGERVGALFDYGGENALPGDRPVFVVDYPAETSPLSRRNDQDPGKVDRFELFIVGREHANAFSELNDPADQRGRFQRQVDAKARGQEETMDYDEDYCRALEYGMPPAAGEGIGIDRLTMLLTDQPSIRDVILFPLMRPE
jgi:lysyl-tRNA synthetase, class II